MLKRLFLTSVLCGAALLCIACVVDVEPDIMDSSQHYDEFFDDTGDGVLEPVHLDQGWNPDPSSASAVHGCPALAGLRDGTLEQDSAVQEFDDEVITHSQRCGTCHVGSNRI